MTASQNRTKLVAPAVLLRFLQGRWWRHAWFFSLAFLPHFKAPAILFTLASLLITGAISFFSSIKVIDGVADGNKAIPALIWSSTFLMVAGVLLIVTIFISTIRLAGFARAFLRFPLLQIPEKNAAIDRYRKQIKVFADEGMEQVRKQKGTLIKAWLISGAIALPAIFVLNSCVFMALGLTPEAIRQFNLSPEVVALQQGSFYMMLFMLAVLTNYSVTTLAVSVLLDRTARETSIEALILAFTTAPALIFVTVLSSVALTVVTTPYAIPAMFGPPVKGFSTPSVLDYFWQIWQGATSIIVVPVGLAMMLETVRDCVVKPVLETTEK
jgi:hypothetical protein